MAKNQPEFFDKKIQLSVLASDKLLYGSAETFFKVCRPFSCFFLGCSMQNSSTACNTVQHISQFAMFFGVLHTCLMSIGSGKFFESSISF